MTQGPGSGGVLLMEPEDFRVDEILAYPLCGEGEHLFIRIEKRSLTTDEAARRLGLRNFGAAGYKDKAAIATQWLSTQLDDFEREADGVRVLEERRHTNKLRRGHQRGNRFSIVIRQVPPGGIDRAQAVLAELSRTGVPNAFGPQRFGRDGDNAARALAFLRGEERAPRDRRKRDLLLSALQSEVFNRILTVRIERDLFCRAIEGDVMVKHASGGMFTVEDVAAETARVERLEISPTGVLPGKRTKIATALEAEAIAALELTEEDVRKMGAGTRRALRYPLDPEARIEAVGTDAFQLEVTLPSGAYATVLLDEIVKPAGVFNRQPATASGCSPCSSRS